MKKAVGYLRVSTKQQAAGTGFPRQREAIRRYASEAHLQVAAWYEEAFTGTEAERPAFASMLEDLLGNGIRVIVIESMDRLARDLMVQHQLIALLFRKGLTLISAATGQDICAAMRSDPMLKALVQIQGVFAELEKGLLVRKLATGRQRVRRATGRCEGRKPFGHYESERNALRRMRQLGRKPRGNPRRGPYQIARIMNQEGHRSRSGRPWSGPVVRRILERR